MNNFILTNDPDHETLDLIKPIYKSLNEADIKITTAVFCKMENDGSDLSKSCRQRETACLEDSEYRDFMLKQRDEGHEIAFHGYSQISNTRDKFLEGLEIYKDIFGEYPHTYIEHGGKKGHHPDSGCKKETLIWEGKNKNSDYYVEDAIKEKIKCVWAYHSLLDNEYESCLKSDFFYEEDGLVLFKRYRIHYAELVTKLGDLFIGYTHFGYRGYTDRRRSKWEYWDNNNHQNVIKNIEIFCKRNNFLPTTIKDYLNE